MRDRKRAAQILKWLIEHYPDRFPVGATVREASENEDKTEATDVVIETPVGNSIAVGYREEKDTSFRVLRLRYENQGQPTEFSKIRAGNCNWYLYVWHDGEHILMVKLVDLDAMREHGWFTTEKLKSSWRFKRWDELTSNVFVLMHWLRDDGCMILEHSFVTDGNPIFRKAYPS